MRRFLLLVLILSLVVALAGSLTAAVLLYQSGSQAQADRALRTTRVAELEDELGALHAERDSLVVTGQARERRLDDLGGRIATLQADVATLAAPAPTPAGVVPTPLPSVPSLTPPADPLITVLPPPDAEGLDPATLAVMDTIQVHVSELRGLEPQRPVTRTLFTRPELEAYLIRELEEDMTPQEARLAVIEMAAFDLLPLDTDLWQLMVSLYTEQIAGFYDTDADLFVVIADDGEFGPLDKIVYAHEFVHVLQDQAFGLDALDPGDANDDASLALKALVEGDATLTMQLYALQALEPGELYQALSESMNVPTEVLESAPAAIVAQMNFPYEAGLAFVQFLYQEGGFAAVDRAFADPPQSTEQVLHPERYLAGEPPQVVSLPPLTDTLGAGWEHVAGNVLGEFGLQLYLGVHLDDRLAAAAADGWGGDRYVVHTHPETDGIVMVLKVAWDTEPEAAEFMRAYRSFRQAYPRSVPVDQFCWANGDAVCAFQSGAVTLIIRAPDLELAGRLQTLFPDF
jgi:hypothetical protein